MELAPDDPEIMFNFAAVLEATGQLTDALEYYKKSKEHGVDKAAVHIRNVRWTESAAHCMCDLILPTAGQRKDIWRAITER